MADLIGRLTAELEEAVASGGDPVERASRVRRIRADIEHLLGVADTYIADTRLAEQARELQDARAALLVRENADIRAEAIRRGLATPAQLDAMGYVSHEKLDEAAEQGQLQEAVGGALKRAFGLGLLSGDAFNAKVRRDHGRFADKPGTIHGRSGGRIKSAVPDVPHGERHQRVDSLTHPARLKVETPTHDGPGVQPIKELHGERGGVKGKKFKVYPTPAPEAHGEDSAEVVIEKGGQTKKVRVKGDAPEHATAKQIKHDRAKRGDSPHALEKAGEKRINTQAKEARRRARAEKDPEKRAELEKVATDLEAKRGSTATVKDEGKKAVYDERTQKLEKGVEKQVTTAAKKGKLEPGQTTPVGQRQTTAQMNEPEPVRQPGEVKAEDLTSAEVSFNETGRVSQRTLLAYANEAATQPTTVERYRNEDGSYHPSRAQLHARLVDAVMRERNDDGSLSFTNPYLAAPDGDPTVMFTGGGYASGKGGVVKTLKARGEFPEGAMLLDPDTIKAELPEFQDALETDPEANLLVYEEAWDIAQAAQRFAQERRLNVVVDGISNTSSDEMAARVKSFTDAGYTNPRAYYVSIPTDEAIRRAQNRAAEAQVPGDRRMIPETIMRSVHRDVSATVPALMERTEELGLHVEVWDNNRQADDGGRALAEKVAEATPEGKVTVHDDSSFQSILDKANEAIPGVDQPGTEPQPKPEGKGIDVTITPETEAAVTEQLTKLFTGTDDDNEPQPFKDGDSLYEAAEKAQPEFEQIVDHGAGVDKALDASPLTLHSKEDFEAAKEAVKADPDKAYVVIAAMKEREAAERKVEGKYGGDWGRLGDVVRGSVLVPSAQDLPTAIESVVKEAEAKGWSVTGHENRVVPLDQPNSPGPTKAGYRDVKLTLTTPDGLKAELQINTTDNWLAKEVEGGHALYEEERDIQRAAGAAGREVTVEEQARIDALRERATELYHRHWAQSLQRNPGFAEGAPASA